MSQALRERPSAADSQREYPDGRVELLDTSAIEQSPLYNRDLAPVPVAERRWTTYNFAALWISMAHCIPTYMLSSGLIAAGMNWGRPRSRSSSATRSS